MCIDIKEATASITKAQRFDANANILFMSAHDRSVRGVADLFPARANEWKSQGWRDKMFWAFLDDFEAANLASTLSLDVKA